MVSMKSTKIKDEIVLRVEDLRTHFQTRWGTVKAVDGVSFNLRRGETLGIVGESGSGKSVTALSLMRLVPSPPGRIVGGKVILDGENILELSENKMGQVRGSKIGIILQGPHDFLKPRVFHREPGGGDHQDTSGHPQEECAGESPGRVGGR